MTKLHGKKPAWWQCPSDWDLSGSTEYTEAARGCSGSGHHLKTPVRKEAWYLRWSSIKPRLRSIPTTFIPDHRGGNSITGMPCLKWNSMSDHNPAKQLKSKGSDMLIHCQFLFIGAAHLLWLASAFCCYTKKCVRLHLFETFCSHKHMRDCTRLQGPNQGCTPMLWLAPWRLLVAQCEGQALLITQGFQKSRLQLFWQKRIRQTWDPLGPLASRCFSGKKTWGADLDPPTVASADLCSASATPGCRIAARLLYLHLTENVSNVLHVATRRVLRTTASLLSCLTSATLCTVFQSELFVEKSNPRKKHPQQQTILSRSLVLMHSFTEPR